MASTNRGCKAITQAGGCRAALLKDGITRAPCLRMPDAMAAAALKKWCEAPENFDLVRDAFQSTTKFGKLKAIKAAVAGRNVYLRFVCFAGDAMGMNMVSKGVLAVVDRLQASFFFMFLAVAIRAVVFRLVVLHESAVPYRGLLLMPSQRYIGTERTRLTTDGTREW